MVLISVVVGIALTLDAVGASTVRNRQLIEQLEAFGSDTINPCVVEYVPRPQISSSVPFLTAGGAGSRVFIQSFELPTVTELIGPTVIAVAFPEGIAVVKAGVCHRSCRVEVDGAVILSSTNEMSPPMFMKLRTYWVIVVSP